MKIQPIDCVCNTPAKVVKSRLKRLFSVERLCGIDDQEPNSVCLGKMVQNFIEGNNEKLSVSSKCSRNRCNCFHGNCSDTSDDEFYFSSRPCGDSVNAASSSVTSEVLKNLASSVSTVERNLLSDTTKIIERSKICNCKKKDECRKTVIEGLIGIGYNASICKSKWEKSYSPSYPSGDYEYIDVIIEGERLIIDLDFKSEFEIARPTGNYKTILQSLPSIFVGKADRLQQIVCIASGEAKQSLKKKGMHVPPWRKTEYMKSKWLSPYTRMKSNKSSCSIRTKSFSGDFELVFKKKTVLGASEEEKIQVVVTPWVPPAVKPKKGFKVVAGLAFVLKENPK